MPSFTIFPGSLATTAYTDENRALDDRARNPDARTRPQQNASDNITLGGHIAQTKKIAAIFKRYAESPYKDNRARNPDARTRPQQNASDNIALGGHIAQTKKIAAIFKQYEESPYKMVRPQVRFHYQPLNQLRWGVPAQNIQPQRAPWELYDFYHYAPPLHYRLREMAMDAIPQRLNTREHSVGLKSASLFQPYRWRRFEQEENANYFFSLLKKLAQHDANHPQDNLKQRLKQVYETLKQDSALRAVIFNQAQEGVATCEDRAIHSFNIIENRCLIQRLIKDEPVSDQKMFTILRGLCRQEQLRKEVTTLITKYQAQQNRLPLQYRSSILPLEIHLGFELKLKDVLGLPGETRYMTYGHHAVPFLGEARAVAENILKAEQNNPQLLKAFMLNNDYWREHIEKKYHAEKEAISVTYEKKLAQIEEDNERNSISDNDYIRALNQLMKEREKALLDWFKVKSSEIINQLIYVENRS